MQDDSFRSEATTTAAEAEAPQPKFIEKVLGMRVHKDFGGTGGDIKPAAEEPTAELSNSVAVKVVKSK